MSALRRAAVCLCLGCALALAATGADANASPSPMVDKINQVRRTHGLGALHYSPRLARSSSRLARHLLRTDRFAHGSRIIASGRFSSLGEILALTRGWKLRRKRTLGAWLRSSSHRAVVLSSSFSSIGAARVRGYFAGGRAVVWTIQFGR